jgi:hypothetical protein
MRNNKQCDKLRPPNCSKNKNNASVTNSHLPRGLAMPAIPEILIPNFQTAVDRVTDFWNVEPGREFCRFGRKFGEVPEQFLPDFPCE